MMSAIPSGSGIEPAWVDEVLRFWFEDDVHEPDWFAKNPDFDARIRDRFLPLHQRLAAQGGIDSVAPRPLLAAVIVLDQFSRNMFRGDPRAYAADPMARRLARTAIDAGSDTAMSTQQRLFLYLPFQHSENAGDQQLAMVLMEALGNDEWTRHARAHKDIIDRFGRFPHRNAILDRISTPQEIAFLRQPGSSF
jgi:uncharacterized protein (DUF924 family)